MLIVDRFEEDKAVVFDDEKQIILDRDKLSPFVREGDVITLSDSGIYVCLLYTSPSPRDS